MRSKISVLSSMSTIRLPIRTLLLLLFALVSCSSWQTASAQTLNWEGQTGIFVTPFAYVAPSPDKGLGMPIVGYHYLNAGSVLGGFHQLSLSASAFHRLEFGYTRDFHQAGSTVGLSNLWSDGFNVFHGKVNFLSENVGGDFGGCLPFRLDLLCAARYGM